MQLVGKSAALTGFDIARNENRVSLPVAAKDGQRDLQKEVHAPAVLQLPDKQRGVKAFM